VREDYTAMKIRNFKYAHILAISMKNLTFANSAVFIILFGIALIEAFQKQNWVEALLFLTLGVISLWADFKKT